MVAYRRVNKLGLHDDLIGKYIIYIKCQKKKLENFFFLKSLIIIIFFKGWNFWELNY